MLKLRILSAVLLLAASVSVGCSSPPSKPIEHKQPDKHPPKKPDPQPSKNEFEQKCRVDGEPCVVGKNWDQDNLSCVADIENPNGVPRCHQLCGTDNQPCPTGYGCLTPVVSISYLPRYCVKNECNGYDDTTTCKSNEHCIQKRREGNTTTNLPFTCEPLKASPVAKGGKCAFDSECDKGLVCHGDKCTEACKSSDHSCPKGETCVGYDNPLFPKNESLPDIRGFGICTVEFCNPQNGYECQLKNGNQGTCKAYSSTTGECVAPLKTPPIPIAGDPNAGTQTICENNKNCAKGEVCSKTSPNTKYCVKPCPLSTAEPDQSKRDAACGDPSLECKDPLPEGTTAPTSGACVAKINRGECTKNSDCAPGSACVEATYGIKLCMRRCSLSPKFQSERDKLCNPNGGDRYTCVKAPELDTGRNSYPQNEGVCVESCDSNGIDNGHVDKKYKNICGINGLSCVATKSYGPLCLPPLAKATKSVGDPCTADDPNNDCNNPSLYCDNGTCKAAKTTGDSCSTSKECGPYASCGVFSGKCEASLPSKGKSCKISDDQKLLCAPGLKCLSGTCVEPSTAMPGSNCDTEGSDHMCPAGQYCDPIGSETRGICRNLCQPLSDHLTCGAGEFCDITQVQAQWNIGYCKLACDPNNNQCPDLQKRCEKNSADQSYCKASGTLTEGTKCQARNDAAIHDYKRLPDSCAEGLLCATQYDIDGDPTDVPSAGSTYNESGTCVKECDPFSLSNQGCPADTSCSLEYSSLEHFKAYTGKGICRPRQKKDQYKDGKIQTIENPDVNAGGEKCDINFLPCGNGTLCINNKCTRLCKPGTEGDQTCREGKTAPFTCVQLNKDLFKWGICLPPSN